MSSIGDITGYIIAGGTSSRMGSPKALQRVGGVPMIVRVRDAMLAALKDVVIVSDRPDELDFLGLPIIPDQIPGKGPLGGIESALGHSAADLIFVASCDMPFLTASTIRELWKHHANSQATVAVENEHVHPLCGFYSRSLLPVVRQNILDGRLALRHLLENAGVRMVSREQMSDDVPASALMNVNTPEDLKIADDLAGRLSLVQSVC